MSSPSPVPTGLRRGDLGTLLGALLAVAFSFLPQLTAGPLHVSTWHGEFLATVLLVPVLGLVVALFVVGCAFAPDVGDARLAGTPLRGWIVPLAVTLAIGSVFGVIGFDRYASDVLGGEGVVLGYGAYVCLAGGVLAGISALATELVGVLAAPLVAQRPPPSRQLDESPAGPPRAEPVPEPEPVAEPEPAAVAPFWACFPTPRPIVGLHDRASTLLQLSPREWYLVTGQDATGAVVRLDDGRSGFLLDVSGLTRG